MLNPTKNKTTPITKTVLSFVKPIMIKDAKKRTIDKRNICLGIFFFSPKTAAGPIAIRPAIIAGKYAIHNSDFSQLKPYCSFVRMIGISTNAIVIRPFWSVFMIIIFKRLLSFKMSKVFESSW